MRICRGVIVISAIDQADAANAISESRDKGQQGDPKGHKNCETC